MILLVFVSLSRFIGTIVSILHLGLVAKLRSIELEVIPFTLNLFAVNSVMQAFTAVTKLPLVKTL